jgi:NAD(P)-dependent dehydrogenase (short-subunit alcohol dehydrogenase family)
MPTYVITGSNRGLGLEFVRQLADDGSNHIICGTRSVASDLSALKRLQNGSSKIEIMECDTSSLESISSFANHVIASLGPSSKIDFLLNNAGINSHPDQRSLSITPEALSAQMTTNVLGPAKTVEYLQPLLKKGSVVMNMTSGLSSMSYSGSKTDNSATTYSLSKAALNMLTVHQAIDLKDEGVIFVCMDPGWVKTDMGGDEAPLVQEESISGMLKCLKGLGSGDSGRFYGYDGKEKAW